MSSKKTYYLIDQEKLDETLKNEEIVLSDYISDKVVRLVNKKEKKHLTKLYGKRYVEYEENYSYTKSHYVVGTTEFCYLPLYLSVFSKNNKYSLLLSSYSNIEIRNISFYYKIGKRNAEYISEPCFMSIGY